MPRKTDSGNAADWLVVAREDIDAVKTLAAARVGYHVCRSKLAEATEKVLKAELLRHGWPLLRTHDLQFLVDELVERGSPLVASAQELAENLSEAYLSGRYPGFDLEDEDWPVVDQQLSAVEALWVSVVGAIGEV